MKNINRNVYRIIFFFVLATLLFPAFVLNKIIFLLILVYTALNQKLYRLRTTSPFLVFFIFLYGFILAFFNNSDFALSLQFFLAVLVLFLIYPIDKYKVDMDQIAKISGIVMALYTGIAYLIIIVYNTPITPVFNDIFVNYSSGSNGLRELTEEGVLSFHIGTAPFIYLSLCLYTISFATNKKISSLLAIIILFITVFISASRGTILICVLAIVSIIFFRFKLVSKIIFLSIAIPLVSIAFLYLLTNTTTLDPGEVSNNIKLGHFQSFLENINFFNFFAGNGLGAYYYSKGSQSMKAHTEITPVDMVRYFGFILTPILYIVIVFPLKTFNLYFKRNKIYIIIFLLYVFNSFTNPTMFNSYGLLIVLWYWSKILSGIRSEVII